VGTKVGYAMSLKTQKKSISFKYVLEALIVEL
jgi:hypothetical protein